MPYVTRDDVRLYYECSGQGEPLVLVSGLGIGLVAWARQRSAFARDHTVIAFDNRDCGRSSPAAAGYTLEDMADDALCVADGAGVESFHLVGISLGGAIAQHVALGAPERVRTLTLAATFAGGATSMRRLMCAVASMARHMPPEDFIDWQLALMFSDGLNADEGSVAALRGGLQAQMLTHPLEAFGRQAVALADHDVRGRLSSLGVPVHVLGGTHDMIMGVWRQHALAAEVPGCHATWIDAGSHAVHVERADEFNAAVLGFLARARALSAGTTP